MTFTQASKQQLLREGKACKATRAELSWAYYEAALRYVPKLLTYVNRTSNAYTIAFAADQRDGVKHPCRANLAAALARILEP